MIRRILSFLSLVMLVPIVAAAYSTDIAVAAKQPCVTVAEATKIIYTSRNGCAVGTTVTYFNVCKGQVFSNVVLPEDTVLHDNMCLTDVQATVPVIPALPTSHDIFGEVANGQTNQALADIMKVLQANPNSAKAHWVLANVLYSQGKIDQAKAEFDKAHAIDPKDSFDAPLTVYEFNAKLFAFEMWDSKVSYKTMGIVVAILIILLILLLTRSSRKAKAAAAQAQADKPRATVYPIRLAADPIVAPAPLPIVTQPEPETKGDDNQEGN